VTAGKTGVLDVLPRPKAIKPWWRHKLSARSSFASTTRAKSAISDRVARSTASQGQRCSDFEAMISASDVKAPQTRNRKCRRARQTLGECGGQLGEENAAVTPLITSRVQPGARMQRIWRIGRIQRIAGSITCVFSMQLQGSNPSLSATLFSTSHKQAKRIRGEWWVMVVGYQPCH
jgi:hypothetical protein